MLELRNIRKSYKTGEFVQVALNDINLKFRDSEFVSILGPSGSGKTTCLNILGGLDQYDSGDLIINGESTKNFKDKDWDAYRNNSVGFVFQSYNLISHLTVIDNVELGMTLSGVSPKIKRKKALEVLERVGLKEHVHKKPNQLSGGQMQRVAIARALANDPDIIMADEPTGALDSETSIQIMDLIREIAKDKLVVMVTHNEDLANEYSDRIINLLDGNIISDTNPYNVSEEDKTYQLKKTSMKFWTALKLSGKNIWAKKWRTLLTAFASSIGIIGISLILSLSNGFGQEIENFEAETLSGFPITISKSAENIDANAMKEHRNDQMKGKDEEGKFPEDTVIYSYDIEKNSFKHKNKIDSDYIDYIKKIDKEYVSGLSLSRSTALNLLKKEDDKALEINQSMLNLQPYPTIYNKEEKSYLEDNYDVLAGRYPSDSNDLILIVDSFNRIPQNILLELGIDSEEINFDEIIGYEIKSVRNDDFYKKEKDRFIINGDKKDLSKLYELENNEILTIVGILRVKEENQLELLPAGLAYNNEFIDNFIEISKESKIVKEQEKLDYNILTQEPFISKDKENDENFMFTKEYAISKLGGLNSPFMISIYPKDFESKDKVINYLKDWNKDKDDDDIVVHTDLAESFTSLTGEIMGAVTLVLIGFASISLIVSLIMIGIITYISVLERTKEIGVLRALGARKKDITRVFNAETFLIGSFSGILAISISYGLLPSMNSILYKATNIENIAVFDPKHAAILVALNITLTLLGGFIPAKMASKKDPVEALRND